MVAAAAGAGELRWSGRRWVALFAVAATVGCGLNSGPPVAHLRGKVTIDGKPVPSEAEARIMFVPPTSAANRNSKPAMVPIVNGEYDAPDVPVGQVIVRFDIQRPTGREFARGMKESENLVPEVHREGIEIAVTEGDHPQDFEL